MTQGYDLAALLAERERRRQAAPKPAHSSLEELLTDPRFFGLTTATAVQRAICRITDGRSLGDLATDPDVIRAVGSDVAVAALPRKKPRQVVILSGIRCGKSLLAAAHAVHWSQVCDVSKLGPGEIPRVSVVSIEKDLADVIFGHVVGRVSASPELKKLILGKPTADTITLRHPTGTPVEICVVAGSRSGSSLVARWSAGCVFDEFPRMNGEDQGVVNWDHQQRAVLERILPGGQLMSIGSPWAPQGPAYEAVRKHYNSPSEDVVLLKTPAWTMNPGWWTPERVNSAKLNPDTYQTEVLGEFASPEESLFSTVEIDAATRKAFDLPYDQRCTYRAAMDPAMRGNGWTLVIGTRIGDKKYVACVREWVGSKVQPLSPRDVMAEIAKICKSYGVSIISSDQFGSDALRDIGQVFGLTLREVRMDERMKAKKYMALRQRLAIGEIELHPDRTLRADLLSIRKKTTPAGFKIVLPPSSDGRHADYAPSLLLCMSEWIDDASLDAAPEAGTPEAAKLFADKMREQRFEHVKKQIQRDVDQERRDSRTIGSRFAGHFARKGVRGVFG